MSYFKKTLEETFHMSTFEVMQMMRNIVDEYDKQQEAELKEFLYSLDYDIKTTNPQQKLFVVYYFNVN
jgi:hypothetical protein